jgi:hypothetical protein
MEWEEEGEIVSQLGRLGFVSDWFYRSIIEPRRNMSKEMWWDYYE